MVAIEWRRLGLRAGSLGTSPDLNRIDRTVKSHQANKGRGQGLGIPLPTSCTYRSHTTLHKALT